MIVGGSSRYLHFQFRSKAANCLVHKGGNVLFQSIHMHEFSLCAKD